MSLYELAYNLGLTVSYLKHHMDYDELLGWHDYFARRPIGWKEDSRTYMLLSAQGVKESGDSLFPSLAVIKQETEAAKDEGKISTKELKSSVFFQQMLSGIDGDSIGEILGD